MVETLRIIGAWLGGILLGAFFFVGLWWTVQKGVTARQPALLFLASMLIRTLAAVAGFYYLSRGDWRTLTASLTGFIVSRFIVTRFFNSSSAQMKVLPRTGAAQ